MKSLSKMILTTSLFISTAPAWGACIMKMQDATREPQIYDFLNRMGSIENLPGTWEGSGHTIEFRVTESGLQSRIDSSDLANVRICTTEKPKELRLEVLNERGAIIDTSKIKLRPDGSIGVQNKRAPFGIWVAFTRTDAFDVPASVIASLARPETRTALAINGAGAVSN